MEMRQLRHFVALAEEGGFTRAAEREFIVQSGLSSSIRALEKDVGVELYVRGTHPVRLTAEGVALLPAARRALAAAAATYDAIQAVRGLLVGQLRVGAYTSTRHLLPFTDWLAEFGRDHPDLDIQVQKLPSLRMHRMVADGELDCALVTPTPDYPDDLELMPLASEPYVLICSLDHPLAQVEQVALDGLNGERFVETQPQWASRVMTDMAFAGNGLTRRIVCEVGEWAMVADLVAAGLGIAFVPCGVAADSSLPVHALKVTGFDFDFRRRIDLALPRGSAASPAARRFAEHVQRNVQTTLGDWLSAS
ncbi:LysR family transcriptional regulator [Nocardia arthritidis]|uniref:LysR family transcriptional regulator n=1 Tax=Nocardia arthritidis TaxID=228602 RepID=A0A6G9YL32_9NOCA|nr:LysR family transcriptional regulator [Nocardia arthritidis]QIS13979.1 LysR family transcriptional regulator [Nocardia arthritidis]